MNKNGGTTQKFMIFSFGAQKFKPANAYNEKKNVISITLPFT